MKATGIVRRIDDLGRVVIPKEIRRTMRIREGDPLEIFTDREGEVIFKKYSPIGELNAYATHCADTLNKTGDLPVGICDRDEVVACAGVSKRDFMERRISEEAEHLADMRSLYVHKPGDPFLGVVDSISEWQISCLMPIITEGDVVGFVAALTAADKVVPDVEVQLVRTAALFLSKIIEN